MYILYQSRSSHRNLPYRHLGFFLMLYYKHSTLKTLAYVIPYFAQLIHQGKSLERGLVGQRLRDVYFVRHYKILIEL